MIRLSGISKSFGDRTLFSSINWHVSPRDRVGLIGENGAGKSTLLQILAGDSEPDSGDRIARNRLKVGYLRQEIEIVSKEKTLLTFVLEGRDDLLRLESRLSVISRRIERADSGSADKLAYEMALLEEEYKNAGGYGKHAKAKGILAGLGFSEADYHRSLTPLSGGWRMRAELGKILFSSPDLLLLDEPTNHLDLESTVWLESFLKGFEGAILLISHDRYFLNRMVDNIAELTAGELTLYPYPYDKYLVEKENRIVQIAKKAERQRKEIERQERFIERFRAKNTKATQVQSRVRALGKIDIIKTAKKSVNSRFRFRESGRINDTAVELTDVVFGYNTTPVYDNLNFTLRRGDRVALAGPNGAGKSTLIKIIAGTVDVKSGKVKTGSLVTARSFAQHHVESFNMENTVLNETTRRIPSDSIPMARTALGAFLFRNDDVNKKVKILSGGEKSRLALAKLALTPTNLLLLDEPTNHLDLSGKSALEKALQSYSGCIVMISHDRAFIDSVANKVIHVENGELTEYLGGYSYYESQREQVVSRKNLTRTQTEPRTGAEPVASKKEIRRQAADNRKRQNELAGPLKSRLKLVEIKISEWEELIREHERTLADPSTYSDKSKIRELTVGLSNAKSEAGELMEEWEEISGKLEFIKAENPQ